MSQLAKLLEDQRYPAPPASAAKAAKAANQKQQISKVSNFSNGEPIKSHLMNLCKGEGLPFHLVESMNVDELLECEAETNQVLIAYLYAKATSLQREAGRVPEHYTAKARCKGCGLIWIQPEVAAALPKVNGEPYCLGCPWCHVRGQGKEIPRPI